MDTEATPPPERPEVTVRDDDGVRWLCVDMVAGRTNGGPRWRFETPPHPEARQRAFIAHWGGRKHVRVIVRLKDERWDDLREVALLDQLSAATCPASGQRG